jgi:CHAD domain-containing protein
MSFELKKNERIPKGVRRVVCKRIDKALQTMSGGQTLTDQAVHNARKRFKEIRGALRLVRGELGEKYFRRENETFRDAGRPLSAVRDAKVLVDSLNGLIEHFDGRVNRVRLGSLRQFLQQRRRDTRKQILHDDHAVDRIARHIRAARKRVMTWPLQKRGWRAIEDGLRTVYRQGRDAMKKAGNGAADEALHEWRKRVKDLRYELELLQAVWPETIKPLADQAHHLTNLLGDDHDLAVLRTMAGEHSDDNTSVDMELLFALIDERRAALQKEARELGEKLYKEPPAKFVARMKGYWKAAKAQQT